MDNQALAHSGIKGMRWGVRRYQYKDGTLTPAGKKRYNKELAKVREEEKILKNKQATKAKIDKLEARKKAVEDEKRALKGDDNKSKKKPAAEIDEKPKKKTIKDMSDEELNAVINRIRLEKQYKELTTPKEKEKNHRGRDFVVGILETSGKNLATQVVNQVGATLINKAFAETQFGKKDKDGNPVEVVFANNKKKDK